MSHNAVCTATYTLIHAFLIKRSHEKAAAALKKAARDIVVLEDGVDADGPSLDEILEEWKGLKAKADTLYVLAPPCAPVAVSREPVIPQ